MGAANAISRMDPLNTISYPAHCHQRLLKVPEREPAKYKQASSHLIATSERCLYVKLHKM